MSLRSRALNGLFRLLYGPLVFLHEPAGACLFGPSWSGRRRMLAARLPPHGVVLDLGCGNGHLLSILRHRTGPSLGVDLSLPMSRRARTEGARVVLADAKCLPLETEAVVAVVCSYPGPWIRDERVWRELARVSEPGAQVLILLGGTVTRGRWSSLRSALIRAIYGRQLEDVNTIQVDGFGHECIPGCITVKDDEWGQSLIWIGRRLER